MICNESYESLSVNRYSFKTFCHRE